MNPSNGDAFRRRILSAIGVSAMAALASQCGEAPEFSSCGPTPPLCFELEVLATCRDAGALGTAGEAAGGNGSAGAPGAPATCPTANDAEICTRSGNLSDRPPYLYATRDATLCCYEAQFFCGGGRPFVVDGTTRVAGVVAGNDWSISLALDEATGDPTDAALLARGWLADALAEHASIASFARFTLELLALGAPSDMVLAAQRAGVDEVRHARVCFALASRYAGKLVQPGALETEGALRALDLVDFAYRTVLEGCVGETLAAFIVAEQARSATQPALRRALERIARDEETHAELAWRAVRWALDRGGMPVHAAVARAFHEALRPAALVRLQAEPDLRRYGRLRSVDIAEVRARGLREIIEPCAQTLLARRGEKVGTTHERRKHS